MYISQTQTDDDEDTEDSNRVKVNTENNKHIPDDEE